MGVVQYVFSGGSFRKAFFVTYFGAASFAVYMFSFCFNPDWSAQYKRLRRPHALPEEVDICHHVLIH
jgi:hypothetical protein